VKDAPGDAGGYTTNSQEFGERYMATSRNKPTDVMLRMLIMTIDRQSQQIAGLTEAIHRMASGNEEVIAILAETIAEAQPEPERATHLGQVLDDMERGFT
jgi:hypothetical protein